MGNLINLWKIIEKTMEHHHFSIGKSTIYQLFHYGHFWFVANFFCLPKGSWNQQNHGYIFWESWLGSLWRRFWRGTPTTKGIDGHLWLSDSKSMGTSSMFGLSSNILQFFVLHVEIARRLIKAARCTRVFICLHHKARDLKKKLGSTQKSHGFVQKKSE